MGTSVIDAPVEAPFELDLDLWKKLYLNSEKEYLRKRLLVIKYLYEGKDRKEIPALVGCSRRSISVWKKTFLEGGLKALTTPIERSSTKKFDQIYDLIGMILNSQPKDYGISGDEWSAKNIQKLIFMKWGIKIQRSTMYGVLNQVKEASHLLKIKLGNEPDLNLDLWHKLYSYNQEESSRKRLWAVKYLHEGKSRYEIRKLLDCTSKTLHNWINYFNTGGLEGLLSANRTNLASDEKKQLMKILRNKKPVDYGIKHENDWNGKNVMNVAHLKLGFRLTVSQICEILEESKTK